MIGRIQPQTQEVTVIGAGISGLLSAYFLDRAGYQVTLVDAAPRVGGLISTAQTPLGLVECAAHSIPATPSLRELCADLGVELSEIRPDAKARWIYRRGKPRRFPLSPFEAFGMLCRAYFALAPAGDPESLTLEEWAKRFLGDKALRYLIAPFVRGIYGASPSELSVSAAFPALCVPRGHSLLSYLLAKKWRSHPPQGTRRRVNQLPRGPIVAPRGGMQALTDALGRRLQEKLGSRFRLGVRVDRIPQGNVVLCVPAADAARILSSESPESRDLASALHRIRYSGLTTATIFAEARAFSRAPRGLGVLVSAGEGRKCLGILYNSSAFPERVSRDGMVSLTMMFGEDSPAPESAEFRELVLSELRAILGFKGEPLAIHARRWERAIPKYDAHLLKTWECAEQTWCAPPGRVLFGNYTGQVSIRGMLEQAKTLASSPAQNQE